MYLESFQSYVWNCVASKRLVILGNKPAVGDLVLTGQGSKEVRVLEQQDLEENGRGISIYDVVLPLPGRAVVYPTNQVLPYARAAPH
jgi:tRNA pseudouridine13 synthase